MCKESGQRQFTHWHKPVAFKKLSTWLESRWILFIKNKPCLSTEAVLGAGDLFSWAVFQGPSPELASSVKSTTIIKVEKRT